MPEPGSPLAREATRYLDADSPRARVRLATVGLGVVVLLVTGCAASESAAPVHTPKHVEAAFARAELPLTAQGLNDPSGARLPQDYLRPSGERASTSSCTSRRRKLPRS